MDTTEESLEKELEKELKDLNVDLEIPDSLKLQLLNKIRQELVLTWHNSMINARLNDIVENKTVADRQREEAKKLVKQIHQVDIEIKQLKLEE